MKIILTEEIHGLGARGDVVTVRDGYARNYLLPKNMARVATRGNLKSVEQERQKWSALSSREKEQAQAAASSLEGVRLTVTKKVGEAGTLFGSVTATDVSQALADRGIELDRRRIHLASPIKTAGEHTVEIRLHREVAVNVIVDVVSDAAKTATSTAPLPGTAGHAQAAAAVKGEQAAPSEEPTDEPQESTMAEDSPVVAEAGEETSEEAPAQS